MKLERLRGSKEMEIERLLWPLSCQIELPVSEAASGRGVSWDPILLHAMSNS